jgi:hypothetical protein
MGRTPEIEYPVPLLHVVAETLYDPQALVGARPASGGSRAFH